MKDIGTDIIENRVKSTPIAKVAPELKQHSDNTEITKTCAVLGCDDSKKLNADNFFRFPEDSTYRQLWADLTGRNNWTPTDYSYMCIQHFSVDSFIIDAKNQMALVNKAVPSLKLPNHVLEVEYIEEETLDNEEKPIEEEKPKDEEKTNVEERLIDDDITDCESEMDVDTSQSINDAASTSQYNQLKPINPGLLKLFTEVQMMQRQCVGLKDKLKYNMKLHNRQNRFLNRLKKIIEVKKEVVEQKKKKKARILLSLQDKIREDNSGLVMAMPTRHTEDLKNFALSIYKYSPQAYVYVRNSLRTMLPSTELLESWIAAGYRPKNILTSNNLVKVSAEQTETELSCKITLR